MGALRTDDQLDAGSVLLQNIVLNVKVIIIVKPPYKLNFDGDVTQ